MNLIFSIDENNNIEREGKPIFLSPYIPAIQEQLKSLTKGKIVVMGRKTFETVFRKTALPGRTNIVFSKNKEYQQKNVTVVHSKEEFMDAVKIFESDDIYILGGKEIFELFVKDCQYIYFSQILKKYPPGKQFSIDIKKGWNIINSEYREYKGIKYMTYVYKNEKFDKKTILSDEEKVIMDYIVAYLNKHQYMPSVREICIGTGYKSTSSVHYHMNQLFRRGILETDAPAGSPRAFRIAGYIIQKEE